jgi:hypothetical protein
MKPKRAMAEKELSEKSNKRRQHDIKANTKLSSSFLAGIGPTSAFSTPSTRGS